VRRVPFFAEVCSGSAGGWFALERLLDLGLNLLELALEERLLFLEDLIRSSSVSTFSLSLARTSSFSSA